MVIQCKNLISLYILPDQRRVNLRYFDFDQNRLWGLRAYIYFPSLYILPDQRRVNLYLFSFSLHFARSTTGGNLLVLYKIENLLFTNLATRTTYLKHSTSLHTK